MYIKRMSPRASNMFDLGQIQAESRRYDDARELAMSIADLRDDKVAAATEEYMEKKNLIRYLGSVEIDSADIPDVDMEF